MKFQAGNTYSPGRPRGTKNRLCGAFLRDLLEAWERDGADALRVLAKEDPGRLVAIVAGLMPKELEIGHTVLSELTDEELDAALAKLRSEIAQPVMIEAKPVKVA